MNSGSDTNDEPHDNERNEEAHRASLVVEAGSSTVRDQQRMNVRAGRDACGCPCGDYQ
jgi:hypothetical protein